MSEEAIHGREITDNGQEWNSVPKGLGEWRDSNRNIIVKTCCRRIVIMSITARRQSRGTLKLK